MQRGMQRGMQCGGGAVRCGAVEGVETLHACAAQWFGSQVLQARGYGRARARRQGRQPDRPPSLLARPQPREAVVPDPAGPQAAPAAQRTYLRTTALHGMAPRQHTRAPYARLPYGSSGMGSREPLPSSRASQRETRRRSKPWRCSNRGAAGSTLRASTCMSGSIAARRLLRLILPPHAICWPSTQAARRWDCT